MRSLKAATSLLGWGWSPSKSRPATAPSLARYRNAATATCVFCSFRPLGMYSSGRRASRDKRASATFLAGILGLPGPIQWGPFQVVRTDNDANIDFIDAGEEIAPQHYAFLVGETEFDEIFGRIRERGLRYWADPAQTKEQEINHHDGGRGVYFEDPNGHLMEIITRPYGSGGWNP